MFSMAYGLCIKRLCNVRSQSALYAVAIVTTFVILSQLWVVPYENYISLLSPVNLGVMPMIVSNTTVSSEARIPDADIVPHQEAFHVRGREVSYSVYKSSPENRGQISDLLESEPSDSTSVREITSHESNREGNHLVKDDLKAGSESTEQVKKSIDNATERLDQNATASSSLTKPNTTRLELVPETTFNSVPNAAERDDGSLQTVSVSPNNSSVLAYTSAWKKSKTKTTSISDMNSLLYHGSTSSKSLGLQMFSARDKELRIARLQIESAPIIRNAPSVYTSLFRNYSRFIRSYQLMERVLKVYIYKEGQKPVFHQPHLRGIYASEGWFMKLMEGNRHFVVRDPRKAHLYYLPFSSLKLRDVLHQQIFMGREDLENHLNDYIRIIAGKYNFWNRTEGADHFLVACHDWAPRLTRHSMGRCIRALCNSNIARGFEIEKDVSLPVTYIRSAENPARDNGGNRPSERRILAFFAGGMHGYLRPILLHYWNHKEPDMKILGPLPRDTEGKAQYREFMKSSKYCICARGYEVHTPRVVESIYYECVPVIISDNYVPPFFEILEWESFSVFVLEENVPNLRNILLSIPEKRYIEMQNRLKLVQQHFLWHKIPVKYDLFHMILHSIWHNRVFQLKSV